MMRARHLAARLAFAGFSALVMSLWMIVAAAAQQAPPAISFATIDMGRSILTTHDDYFVRMSSWDRSARMGTANEVTEQDYVKFVRASVLDWSPQEISKVRTVWAQLRPKFSGIYKLFPSTIVFIKTTGDEEGQNEYTRANAIILPKSIFELNQPDSLSDVIAHETFHILSRNNPDMRDRLYSIVGFQPCGEIAFPTALISRKLTNPDAPKNDHCIHLTAMPGAPWAIPITYFHAPLGDVIQKKTFILGLELKFLIVTRTRASEPAKYDTASPALFDPNQIEGLYDQIGQNTGYIIHPEEILADNFMMLMNGAKVRSPQIIERLKGTLYDATR